MYICIYVYKLIPRPNLTLYYSYCCFYGRFRTPSLSAYLASPDEAKPFLQSSN